MGLLPLLAATAAAPGTDCAALAGKVCNVAVDRATAIVPAPEWKAEGGGQAAGRSSVRFAVPGHRGEAR